MVEIRLADSAQEDLDSISDYIAEDSPRYAQDFISKVFEKIQILKDYPEIGRMVPEFGNEALRELILGKYRIVYRIYSERLLIILRVIHGSKLL